MLVIRRDRTERLTAEDLDAVRRLLDAAFHGEFTDEDWHHTLGGMHVRGFVDGHMVAHASVVHRTLWCGERAYRTGYVEGVAVDPGHRRRGYGTWVMREVERIIAERYELGALSTTDEAQRLYVGLGWQTWLGPSYVQTPGGAREATPDDDGAIMVLPTAEVDLTEPITCDWREGDVW